MTQLSPDQGRTAFGLDPAASRRPADRERVPDGLSEIAGRRFGGRVVRNMLTTLWTARRL